MDKSKTQDWTAINNIVDKTATFLSKPYPTYVNLFLGWYLKLEKTNYDIQNATLKKWIIDGIPYMKMMINLMNREVSKIEKLLHELLTSSLSLDQKTQKSKIYYEGLRDTTQTVIDFIGCKNDFGEWYVNLLNEYASMPIVKKEIGFFDMSCLTNRNKLLNMSS